MKHRRLTSEGAYDFELVFRQHFEQTLCDIISNLLIQHHISVSDLK